MSVTLPLDRMTTAEKLDAMEAIWRDLSREADAFQTPAWHGTVLEERKAAVQAGQATYSDWEEVRARLRRKLT
jgi:hypothetical protein